MAQVDTSIVTKLRMAILNISKYPRGHRHFSDILRDAIIPFIDLKEGKEFFNTLGDLIDQCILNSANNSFDSEEPFQLEDILFSGSHSEGMHKINLQTNSMSDMDFMRILKNIKVTEEDQKYESRVGTSDFRLQTSDFGLQTSDFRLQTFNFRLRTSDFILQTLNFTLLLPHYIYSYHF